MRTGGQRERAQVANTADIVLKLAHDPLFKEKWDGKLILFTCFHKHCGSNPSDKFDMFSDKILYMSPDTTPVSKRSIGGLALQLFRTPFGATSSSGRGFDGRNLKNSQTKSDFFLIGLSRAITLRNAEQDLNQTIVASGVWEVETELLVLIRCAGCARCAGWLYMWHLSRLQCCARVDLLATGCRWSTVAIPCPSTIWFQSSACASCLLIERIEVSLVLIIPGRGTG